MYYNTDLYHKIITATSYGNENNIQLETDGQAAIVMDVKVGRIMYEKDIHKSFLWPVLQNHDGIAGN